MPCAFWVLHLLHLYSHALILNRGTFKILLKYVRLYQYCAQNPPVAFSYFTQRKKQVLTISYKALCDQGPLLTWPHLLPFPPRALFASHRAFALAVLVVRTSFPPESYNVTPFPPSALYVNVTFSVTFPGPPNKDCNTFHPTLLTLPSSLVPQSTDYHCHMFYLLITFIVCFSH